MAPKPPALAMEPEPAAEEDKDHDVVLMEEVDDMIQHTKKAEKVENLVPGSGQRRLQAFRGGNNISINRQAGGEAQAMTLLLFEEVDLLLE
eukprot:scaffold343703_cov47-Prasinocladus_malaysianus.AAC.1